MTVKSTKIRANISLKYDEIHIIYILTHSILRMRMLRNRKSNPFLHYCLIHNHCSSLCTIYGQITFPYLKSLKSNCSNNTLFRIKALRGSDFTEIAKGIMEKHHIVDSHQIVGFK